MSLRSLVKVFIPKKLFKAIEPWGHLLEALVFNIIYGFPARNMKVIGVTGTNGKTTTSFLIHKMLVESGVNAGLMTTVGYGVGDKITPQIHHMTTVQVPELMKRLKWFKAQKIDWLVLETTSHALAQNRVFGIPYSIAVMTNVTHEHLDYHGTFRNYLNAKAKLFRQTNKNKKGMRTGVVNADDPNASVFEKSVKNPLSYGIKMGDFRASQIKASPNGSSFIFSSAKNSQPKLNIRVNLPGSFNVYNAMAAAMIGVVLDLDGSNIERGIAALKNVEGRMNAIDEGQPFDVIIDYAHTPDSFEILFNDLKPLVKGKMIVMFGSAGRRDEAKRAVQGRLAGEYCDEVVVTEEDDRDIDGLEIMEQIAGGAEGAGKMRDKNLFLIHDREEAIKFTLGRAKAGDTVLLLGKGHEKTIEREGREDPWDEEAVARKALKS